MHRFTFKAKTRFRVNEFLCLQIKEQVYFKVKTHMCFQIKEKRQQSSLSEDYSVFRPGFQRTVVFAFESRNKFSPQANERVCFSNLANKLAFHTCFQIKENNLALKSRKKFIFISRNRSAFEKGRK